MTVILEFLDGDVRIHEEELNYTGMVPIPSVGEEVTFLEAGGWRVVSRHFYYWTGDGIPKAKVSFQVEQPGH